MWSGQHARAFGKNLKEGKRKKKKGKGKVCFFQVIEKTKQIIAGSHSQEFLVRISPLSQEEIFIPPMSLACFKANLPS